MKKIILLIVSLLVLSAFAYSTIIRENIIETGAITTTDLTLNGNIDMSDNNITNINRIENIIYVKESNATDFKTKVESCSNGCILIIPYGNYALSSTVTFKTNSTIINYGSIYVNTGTVLDNYTDAQGGNYSVMMFGNELKDFKFINHGTIEPTKIFNPTYSDVAIFINNSENIEIKGGLFKGGINNAGTGIGIFNSDYINIHDIISDKMNEAVWQECTKYVNINNVVCEAGGHEGECIEMNGYSEYVTISNIVTNGGNFADDQSVDLNANRYVGLNNIISKDANKVIGASNLAGIRFGTCGVITPKNIVGRNIVCENCNESSEVSLTQFDIIELKDDTFYRNKFLYELYDFGYYAFGYDINKAANTGQFTISPFRNDGVSYLNIGNANSSYGGALRIWNKDNSAGPSIYSNDAGNELIISDSLDVNTDLNIDDDLEVGDKLRVNLGSGFFGVGFDNTESESGTQVTIAPYRNSGYSYLNLVNPNSTHDIAIRMWNNDNSDYTLIYENNAGDSIVISEDLNIKDDLDVDSEVVIGGISSDGVGSVVCIKADSNLGTCTDSPDASGNCNCV